jgi:uncharacterized protein YndB with AHSA1/START domain
MEIPSDRTATLTLPSDREIVIVRAFRAPRRLVFDAWTRRDYVPRWYGCAGMTLTVDTMDVREGGTWRWVLRAADGTGHGLSGDYRVVARPAQLVFNERYEPVPGSDHLVTLSFDERDGVTTMTMHLLYPSIVQRDGHLQAGMERGIRDTMDRLDALVAAEAAAEVAA